MKKYIDSREIEIKKQKKTYEIHLIGGSKEYYTDIYGWDDNDFDFDVRYSSFIECDNNITISTDKIVKYSIFKEEEVIEIAYEFKFEQKHTTSKWFGLKKEEHTSYYWSRYISGYRG